MNYLGYEIGGERGGTGRVPELDGGVISARGEQGLPGARAPEGQDGYVILMRHPARDRRLSAKSY